MTTPTGDKDAAPAGKPSNFLRQIIERDLDQGTYSQRHWAGHPGDAATQQSGPLDPARIRTRFPPEPNGYLHVGHAKSICLNFGLAREYGGVCHMRFDDTNPEKEEVEYVEGIKDAVRWLGFDWDANGTSHLYQASDYFDFMYRAAEYLIEAGLAYVDEQSPEQMRANRGDFSRPGVDSPFRSRSIDENRNRFREMRDGKLPDGAAVLRAKIDMASPNINLRDPALYRIKHAEHHNTGNAWCIYPMYTYAHPIEDALENITHSLCTLEFEDQRPFYDWLLDRLREGGLINTPQPRQYEFARLNLTYVVTSKRKLKQLVDEKHVSGWDDPRMPTIVGLRRRGYTPEAIRLFCDRIGVSKADSWIDYSVLETALRDTLDPTARRAMAVLDPLKLVIENRPADWAEICVAPVHPHRPQDGNRTFQIGREIWIEREDFQQHPQKGFHRLYPGNKVRLKYGYVVECIDAQSDDDGKIVEIRARLIEGTKSGTSGADSVKVKTAITWLSALDAEPAEVRMYDRLFTTEKPDGPDFIKDLNPNSLLIQRGFVEASALNAIGEELQIERHGYFKLNEQSGSLSLSRIAALKDKWAPMATAPAAGITVSELLKKVATVKDLGQRLRPSSAVYIAPVPDKYVEPVLTMAKEGAEHSPIAIIRAPGALGKTSLAKYIAGKTGNMYWDLSQLDLGDNVLVGTLLKAVGASNVSQALERLQRGELTLIIDAFDEAHVRSGLSAIEKFLNELTENVASSTKLSAILLARGETADYLSNYLDEQGALHLIPPVFELQYFDRSAATRFVVEVAGDKHGEGAIREAFIAVESSIASGLGVVGDPWSDLTFRSFLGYAPVLQAISAHIEATDNLSKLAFVAQDGAWSSSGPAATLLTDIFLSLLAREQHKVISAIRGAIGDQEGKDFDWGRVYSYDDQLERLSALVLLGDAKHIPSSSQNLPSWVLDQYLTRVPAFFDEHVFLNDGQLIGPAFRDFLLAWALKNDLFSEFALNYADSGEFVPTRVLSTVYRGAPGRSSRSHFGLLIDAHLSVLRANSQQHMAVIVSTADQTSLAIFIGKERARLSEYSLAAKDNGSPVVLRRQVKNLVAMVSGKVELGRPGLELELQNVYVHADEIDIIGDTLRVLSSGTGGGNASIEARAELRVPAVGSKVFLGANCTLALSSTNPLPFPWNKYRLEKSQFGNNRESNITAAFQALTRIARWFKSDKFGDLSCFDELMDNFVIKMPEDPRTVMFSYLKDRQIISHVGSFYVFDSAAAEAVGINWNAMRTGELNAKLQSFLSDFVEERQANGA